MPEHNARDTKYETCDSSCRVACFIPPFRYKIMVFGIEFVNSTDDQVRVNNLDETDD